jgi:hypothetical protein
MEIAVPLTQKEIKRIKNEFIKKFVLNDPTLIRLNLLDFISPFYDYDIMCLAWQTLEEYVVFNTSVTTLIIQPLSLVNASECQVNVDSLIKALSQSKSISKIIIENNVKTSIDLLFSFIRKIQNYESRWTIELGNFSFKDFTIQEMQEWTTLWNNPILIAPLQLRCLELDTLPTDVMENCLEWLHNQQIKSVNLWRLNYTSWIPEKKQQILTHIYTWQTITDFSVSLNSIRAQNGQNNNFLQAITLLPLKKLSIEDTEELEEENKINLVRYLLQNRTITEFSISLKSVVNFYEDGFVNFLDALRKIPTLTAVNFYNFNPLLSSYSYFYHNLQNLLINFFETKKDFKKITLQISNFSHLVYPKN